MFTWGEMWCMTHDALGSSRGIIVVLDMILKTQWISKNTTTPNLSSSVETLHGGVRAVDNGCGAWNLLGPNAKATRESNSIEVLGL
jgi:hypothetical protein